MDKISLETLSKMPASLDWAPTCNKLIGFCKSEATYYMYNITKTALNDSKLGQAHKQIRKSTGITSQDYVPSP